MQVKMATICLVHPNETGVLVLLYKVIVFPNFTAAHAMQIPNESRHSNMWPITPLWLDASIQYITLLKLCYCRIVFQICFDSF